MVPNALQDFFIEEDRTFGAVTLRTFLLSVQAMGGILIHLVIWSGTLINACLQNYTIFLFLSYARNLTPSTKTDNALFIIGICILFAILGGIRGLMVTLSSALASRRIHSRMSFSFIHCKINEFLERVPQGRIINRFSEDIETIDTTIAYSLNGTYITISFLIVSSGMVIWTGGSLWIIAPCTLVFSIGLYIRKMYMALKREAVRLRRISKSPITSCLSQALTGMIELRAHQKQRYMMKNLEKSVDENNRNNLMTIGLDCWFNVMVLNATMLIINIPAYSMVIWSIYSNFQSVDLRFTVLFLMNITTLASYLLSFLNYFCFLESDLISVERCLSFEAIQPEDGYSLLNQERKKFQTPKKKLLGEIAKQDTQIPLFPNGDVVINNVIAKYPQSHRNVLDSITLQVKPGEKIGVVGRTGAGKTSFIKLFWRGLALESGSIKIDDKEIGDQDLKALRREIMVVSQETALFSGTLRENLDPRLEYSMKRTSQEFREREEKIIHTLLEMGFDSTKINKEGLDFIIEGNGDNLSLGERQVISFVRAVIADKQIIILDEATASVDLKTEEMIQTLVEKHFSTKTMFLIAHRIQTILKCDRILVLEQGRVVEFDSIERLLKIENGWFKQLYTRFNQHV